MASASVSGGIPKTMFGVTELSVRSGVPVPTIHHYRKLGLLPPADRLRRCFVYSDQHVAALGAIRALRAHQVRLDTIRRVLPDLMADGGHVFSEDTWRALLAAGSVPAIDPAAERLLEVARQAFARQGYDGVSVGEICESAGIAKGTFYRYFESKDALFVAAALSTVDAVGEELDKHKTALSQAEAVGQLELLLTPLAPLLLEAATRELRDGPTSPGVAASVAQGLATRLGPRLRASGQRLPTARKVVETVILRLVRPALGLRSP